MNISFLLKFETKISTFNVMELFSALCDDEEVFMKVSMAKLISRL